MHATLDSLKKQLVKLTGQVQSGLPNDQPFSVAHNNWSFPGLTRKELVDKAQSLVSLIDTFGGDELPEGGKILEDYVQRIQFLRSHTVPQLWGNANHGVAAYLFTLEGLRAALEGTIGGDTHARNVEAVRRLTTQIRSMEARLKALEPRTTGLASMVERIETAYEAADQLPSDLETLAETQKLVNKALEDASKDAAHILGLREKADGLDVDLTKSRDEALAVLGRCEDAYSAATSKGLATAFAERSSALAMSMGAWVVGFVVALGAAAYFGTLRLNSLAIIANSPSANWAVVIVNLFLSLLSVGAPVWFAWMAAKQIGFRFRLAEDYAFKASVSKAYEGYRREAARVDKDLEARLLASALTRLDELPLRLVEPHNHGSPWHELASSDVVKQAMNLVPDFAQQVRGLAGRAVHALQSATPKADVSADQSDVR